MVKMLGSVGKAVSAPRAPTVALRSIAALLVAATPLLATACQPPAETTVQLGWQFADGRRCADSGVATVEIAIDNASPTLLACRAGGTLFDGGMGCPIPCLDGEGDNAVPLTLPEGARLTLTAQSPSGATLYRGDFVLPDPVPAAATATLYFVGGE